MLDSIPKLFLTDFSQGILRKLNLSDTGTMANFLKLF